MYQPYPSQGRMPEQGSRPQPPRSVRTAVTLMYAGAAVTALSLIVALLTIASTRTALHNARPDLTSAQLHAAVVAYVVAGVVSDAIAIGLWVWMALANRAGRPWARIVASVLFGVNTISLAFGFGRGPAVASLVVLLVIWLIGLATVVSLWRRDASEFYKASAAARGR